MLRGSRGFLFTDSRYHLAAKAVLPKSYSLINTTKGLEKTLEVFLKKYRIRKCGFEGNTVTVRFLQRLKKINRKIKWRDIGATIDRRRIIKKSFELHRIAKAQKITDGIFAALKKWLKKDHSEKAIAWKIECLAREFGADDISFPPIVALNDHAATPHHHVTERKVRRGDLILIDMGVIYRDYCSDMTRVLFTKKPSSLQENIYELVRNAQEIAIKKLKAGVSGMRADNYARKIIEKAGYGKFFGHSLGHGVGLDIHELPNLAETYKEKIPEGCVVTVEPGVYLPGKFGVRLEDMVIVGKNGSRNLTASPKSIQASIISLK